MEIQKLGNDAIVTADNFGPPMREMCEVRFSPELLKLISEEVLHEYAEELFVKIRKDYQNNL